MANNHMRMRCARSGWLVAVFAAMLVVLGGCSTMDFVVGKFVQTEADAAYVDGRYQEAVAGYRKAADTGNARAQFMLGYMYDKGEGVPQSTPESVRWTERAAQSGYTTAQVIMGVRYLSGDGVERSMSRAFQLFNNAARAEDASAFFYLGMMYDAGLGVPRDSDQAKAYYRLARANGMDVPENPMAEVAEARASMGSPVKARAQGNSLVRNTQDALTRLGYNPGPVDGVFGKKTEHAIILFQKNVGLEQTGKASPELLREIQSRVR